MDTHDIGELPHEVDVIPHVWIAMSDGTRLSARIWLPVDVGSNQRVPALLEYHPYRKNDRTHVSDEKQNRYFAAHGYACARVDLRGSGDSDGILTDEYTPQEQLDGVEVINWLAQQDWCTGDVGMIGRSWAGFNALQVAAHRPGPLKAIVTIASTDDRYAEDVHYSGGCLIASEMLPWATRMLAYNAQPPDPKVVGDSWREQWLDRMEQTPPFIKKWMEHQRRDEYWRQGSVCEDYAAIDCAVYAVGGWADPYRNAVLRLLAGLTSPRKGLIGPWAHITPYEGKPGPLIGFLQEALRWWDHWLKGHDTGVMEEPMLRAWITDPITPSQQADCWPGRWVTEESWPPEDSGAQIWYAGVDGKLDTVASRSDSFVVPSFQPTGVDGGTWMSKGQVASFPPDQRAEDGRSVSLTSRPLTKRVEILGRPEMSLRLRCDQPLGLVSVRLCDVSADGTSMLVTKGQQNLTHRKDHASVEPLRPGQCYDVTVPLDAIGYAFVPGHCIRISLSPTYWPGAWPAPEPAKLQIESGEATRLSLPSPSGKSDHGRLSPFGRPESAPPPLTHVFSEETWTRHYLHDVADRRHEVSWLLEPPHRYKIDESGLEATTRARNHFTIVEEKPLSASVISTWELGIARRDWQTSAISRAEMTADASTFHIDCSLEGFEGPDRVFVKSWDFHIPRDGM